MTKVPGTFVIFLKVKGTFMQGKLLDKYGIKQLGYYVKSIEETAQNMADALGAGPFFDMGAHPMAELKVRGKESTSLTRTAMGHMNDIQIELIELANDEPNVYDELGHYGLHHVCIWVDDADAVAKEFVDAGYEIAMELTSGQGLKVYYIDAREKIGNFIEINAPMEQLYMGIKMQHENWDGTRPLRSVAELMGR